MYLDACYQFFAVYLESQLSNLLEFSEVQFSVKESSPLCAMTNSTMIITIRNIIQIYLFMVYLMVHILNYLPLNCSYN